MKTSLSALFQSRLNVNLFRLLPASACYVYMQLIGRLYYAFRRKERRLIEENIRDLLFDRPAEYVSRIAKETFKGIFMHYFEKMFSAFKNIDQIREFMKTKVTIQNLEAIDRAQSTGKGVILVTAHWGAVEFIPWVLGLNGYPTSVILECKTKHLESALSEKSSHINCELLTCSEDCSVFFRALQSLKQNRLLMTECDEVDTWHKRSNRTIDLFGKQLYFDNTLNVLAKKSGAAVVGVFLKRISRTHYTLICEPIPAETSDVDAATGALSLWQKYVREHPDQWYQWKKWKAMKVA